jgi:hypothetical protein
VQAAASMRQLLDAYEQRRIYMNGKENTFVVLYIVALIASIVTVDLLFFRHRFWERLMVNIGIVLVFVAFYLRFLKKP